MDRHVAANCHYRISGYYGSTRLESKAKIEEEFNRAKDECLGFMRKHLQETESMTFEDFIGVCQTMHLPLADRYKDAPP